MHAKVPLPDTWHELQRRQREKHQSRNDMEDREQGMLNVPNVESVGRTRTACPERRRRAGHVCKTNRGENQQDDHRHHDGGPSCDPRGHSG